MSVVAAREEVFFASRDSWVKSILRVSFSRFMLSTISFWRNKRWVGRSSLAFCFFEVAILMSSTTRQQRFVEKNRSCRALEIRQCRMGNIWRCLLHSALAITEIHEGFSLIIGGKEEMERCVTVRTTKGSGSIVHIYTYSHTRQTIRLLYHTEYTALFLCWFLVAGVNDFLIVNTDDLSNRFTSHRCCKRQKLLYQQSNMFVF